jgi:6-phosphogluconolactonase
VDCSSRARSTISIHAVDRATGLVHCAGHVPTETQPRSIAVDPQGRFLAAAGEASGYLSLYQIDAADGSLRPVQRVPAGAGANCILFVTPAI